MLIWGAESEAAATVEAATQHPATPWSRSTNNNAPLHHLRTSTQGAAADELKHRHTGGHTGLKMKVWHATGSTHSIIPRAEESLNYSYDVHDKRQGD